MQTKNNVFFRLGSVKPLNPMGVFGLVLAAVFFCEGAIMLVLFFLSLLGVE